jgi:LysM repeat protein
MRRTTICRSDGARVVAAFALLLAAAPLAAQAPTMITRPIQQARHAAALAGQHTAQEQQPSAQQPAAPAQQRPTQQPSQQPQRPAAAAQGQGRPLGAPPETHTVQQGETLWSLAHQFLGDPLLWPEIYRLNTNVVEDPHWIFPGEELRLIAPPEQPAASAAPAAAPAPSGNVSITPTADTARPAAAPATPLPSTDAPTIFAARARVEEANVLGAQEQRAYRAVRAGEYYSAGFVADRSALESGMLGGNLDKAALRRLSARTTAGLYASVIVAPPAGQAYKRGDLLLAYDAEQTIIGYGDVIRPLGLLRVNADGENGQAVAATVTALYNAVRLGTHLLKVPAYHYDSSVRAVPTDSGVEGQVIGTRRHGEITSVQDVLFVNIGADDGVHLGDIFRIGAAASQGVPARAQAEAIVVHTRAKTATLIVLQVSQPDIRPGAAARQVRRMPS